MADAKDFVERKVVQRNSKLLEKSSAMERTEADGHGRKTSSPNPSGGRPSDGAADRAA